MPTNASPPGGRGEFPLGKNCLYGRWDLGTRSFDFGLLRKWIEDETDAFDPNVFVTIHGYYEGQDTRDIIITTPRATFRELLTAYRILLRNRFYFDLNPQPLVRGNWPIIDIPDSIIDDIPGLNYDLSHWVEPVFDLGGLRMMKPAEVLLMLIQYPWISFAWKRFLDPEDGYPARTNTPFFMTKIPGKRQYLYFGYDVKRRSVVISTKSISGHFHCQPCVFNSGVI